MPNTTPTSPVAAAIALASSLHLAATDVTVLQSSNKLALRLLPCDTVARVAPADQQVAQFEVDMALALRERRCPIGVLDPRVEPRAYHRDGYVVTLWTYYEPVAPEIGPLEYAAALWRLHAGMRRVSVPAPHFTERVDAALRLLADRGRTPALGDEDRALLTDTLTTLRAGASGRREQLLHGEPHPGNVLATGRGPLFIDLETCCRGPVEFDVAHAPAGVADSYPGLDADLLGECRRGVLAMITTWRFDRDDRHPGGLALGAQWLGELRAQVAAEARP